MTAQPLYDAETGELIDQPGAETVTISATKEPSGNWHIVATDGTGKLDIRVVQDGRIGRAIEQIARSFHRAP